MFVYLLIHLFINVALKAKVWAVRTSDSDPTVAQKLELNSVYFQSNTINKQSRGQVEKHSSI